MGKFITPLTSPVNIFNSIKLDLDITKYFPILQTDSNEGLRKGTIILKVVLLQPVFDSTCKLSPGRVQTRDMIIIK
jgi:hypothetical protein